MDMFDLQYEKGKKDNKRMDWYFGGFAKLGKQYLRTYALRLSGADVCLEIANEALLAEIRKNKRRGALAEFSEKIFKKTIDKNRQMVYTIYRLAIANS